jgi:hypothetical protein
MWTAKLTETDRVDRNKERTETCARIDAQKPKEKCEGLLARLQGQLQIVLCESQQFSSNCGKLSVKSLKEALRTL